MVRLATVEARLRELADDSWFYDMPKEQQQQYISDHPASKFSATTGKPAAKDKVKEVLKKSGETVKKVGQAVHKWDEENTAEVKEFLGKGHAEPGSETRRNWGKAIADKATGFVKHLGKDLKEHAHALEALAHMGVKKGSWDALEEKDRKNLKVLAVNLGIFTTSLIVTGGMSSILHAAAHHSAGTVLTHLATDYITEMVVTSASRAAVFASTPTDEVLMGKFVQGFAEYIQNGNADFEGAIAKARGESAD